MLGLAVIYKICLLHYLAQVRIRGQIRWRYLLNAGTKGFKIKLLAALSHITSFALRLCVADCSLLSRALIPGRLIHKSTINPSNPIIINHHSHKYSNDNHKTVDTVAVVLLPLKYLAARLMGVRAPLSTHNNNTTGGPQGARLSPRRKNA